MVILVMWWNHANLYGPRPLEGFCLIDEPTTITWSYMGCSNVAGTYHSEVRI